MAQEYRYIKFYDTLTTVDLMKALKKGTVGRDPMPEDQAWTVIHYEKRPVKRWQLNLWEPGSVQKRSEILIGLAVYEDQWCTAQVNCFSTIPEHLFNPILHDSSRISCVTEYRECVPISEFISVYGHLDRHPEFRKMTEEVDFGTGFFSGLVT